MLFYVLHLDIGQTNTALEMSCLMRFKNVKNHGFGTEIYLGTHRTSMLKHIV